MQVMNSCLLLSFFICTQKLIPYINCIILLKGVFFWRASEASETLFSHVYGISRYIYIYVRLFLYPCVCECFANEIQELRNGRLSSLSGKTTSRSSSRSSLRSSPLHLLLLLQLLQQTCPGPAISMERINFGLLLIRKYRFFVMGS